TCADSLSSKHDCFETGAADLVDGKGRDFDWEAGADSSLARRRLADTGGDNIAHDNFVDRIRCYCRAAYCFFYCDCAQLRCCDTCKVTKKPASLRPCRTGDNRDVFCHVIRSPDRDFHVIVEMNILRVIFSTHCNPRQEDGQISLLIYKGKSYPR